ncbi:MAG: phage tail family protein [Candidatus Peribacteria bacterium]|nr:phage tail family protein [Candidatus Peribacteria bacterium]
MYASIMQSLDDTNHTFGVAIPTNVPFKMSYKDTLITHTELATPLNVEITVKKEGAIVGDTLTVYHRNDYDTGYLSFNHLTTKQGDKIEIDSINQLAYLLHNGNKTDITGLISLSSSRPYLNYGTNLVAVDCGVKHPVLDVVWKWREVF